MGAGDVVTARRSPVPKREPTGSNPGVEPLCHVARCGARVLPLTRPPACESHVTGAAAWRDRVLAELMPRGDDSDMDSAQFPHVLGRMHIGEATRLGGALYEDYKLRVDPRPQVHFSFSDDIYFVLAAAVSGVIGNATYAALKRLVAKAAAKRGRQELEETFELVVREATYERLRVERHADRTVVEAQRVREKRVAVRRRKTLGRRKPNR